MTDKPIIFSGPMVRALLAGRKTMTRRLAWNEKWKGPPAFRSSIWQRVVPGDRLWVKETWAPYGMEALPLNERPIFYRADPDDKPGWMTPPDIKWRLPLHCARWASRLTLVVTAMKVEPLQKITEADVLAEGISRKAIERHAEWFDRRDCPGIEFGLLWDSLHGKGAWDANPEVVALSFAVHKQNIDAPADKAA